MASLSLKGKGVRVESLFEKLIKLAIKLDDKLAVSYAASVDREEKLKLALSPEWKAHHEEMMHFEQGMTSGTREALCEIISLLAAELKISDSECATALWAFKERLIDAQIEKEERA